MRRFPSVTPPSFRLGLLTGALTLSLVACGNDVLTNDSDETADLDGDDAGESGSGGSDRGNSGGNSSGGSNHGSSGGSGGSAATPEEPFTLTLLHINDHHSHLKASTFDYDVSGLPLDTKDAEGKPIQQVTLDYGGFPLLASLFEKLESTAKNPVKIHAGDAITGTLYFSLFQGEADAAAMNEICFDLFALGNHEFDNGDAGLAAFLDDLNGTDHCETAVLAANVVPGEDSAIAQGYLQPYSVRTIEGRKIGFVGIDIADKTKNSSKPDKDTLFLNEKETAQKYIDELLEQGVDKIVLITHYQYENDKKLAAELSGVDVIVGGDSHTLLGSDNLKALGFSPDGAYPTVTKNKDGDTVCIVQSWEYAHVLGELRVEFDETGKVLDCEGTPFLPTNPVFSYTHTGQEKRNLTATDARRVREALEATPEIAFVSPSSSMNVLLADYDAQVAELEKQVIGTVSQNLCLARAPGDSRGAPLCTPADTARYGSDISNIIAKAFLTITPSADISIQNGGGVRVNVAAGELTFAQAVEVLPFTNTLVTLELTGEQIKNVLEDALENAYRTGGSTGSYPYASGLRYFVDASKAKGSRVSELEINPRVSGAWQAIEPSTTYVVVTNDFIASGQDGYTTFGTVFDSGNYVNTFTLYTDGFINYVRDLTMNGESLEKLPVSEYSTQQYISPAGCNHATSFPCAAP